ERHVVHLPVTVVREVAEVVRTQLHNPALDATTHHAMLENVSEHGGKDRDDVESHLCLRVLDLDHPAGDDDPPSLEVDLEHRFARSRDQVLDRALSAHPHVPRRTLEHLFDGSQLYA